MEDPKSFTAPVTGLNDDSNSVKAVSVSSKKSQHGKEESAKAPSVSSEKSKPASERKAESAGSEDTKYSRSKDELVVDNEKSTDIEANISGAHSRSTDDQEQEKVHEDVDPNIVDWDGPDDPANPMNWPAWKIKTHIFLVSSITFIR